MPEARRHDDGRAPMLSWRCAAGALTANARREIGAA